MFLGILAGLMFHYGSRWSRRSFWREFMGNNNHGNARLRSVEQHGPYLPPDVLIMFAW